MLLSFFRRLERPFRTMRPGRLIVLVFLFIILLGAGLLCLPAASRSGEATPFLTSLFTATSATCVTGLIRVDTGTHWAMFGQVVILLLIQVGGLGFMTIACLFFFALRRKIGLRERMVLAQAQHPARHGCGRRCRRAYPVFSFPAGVRLWKSFVVRRISFDLRVLQRRL